MNASKKLAALVGVILLSGMIFTGCSGNGQESSQTSSASVSSETETSSVHSQSDFNSAAEAESNAQSAAVSPIHLHHNTDNLLHLSPMVSEDLSGHNIAECVHSLL